MAYSLATAATATGTVKSTILRAIKAGKVSAIRDEHGQWRIDPAELHRVYPVAVAGNGAGNGASNTTHRAEDTAALAEARQRAAVAETERDLLRGQVRDLSTDRDHWRAIAERLSLPKPDRSDPKPEPAVASTGWRWPWRRSATSSAA